MEKPAHCLSLKRSQFAAKLSKRLCPLSLITRFSRAEVDSQRAELCRARRLRCTGIYIAPPGDLEIDEARSDDSCLELCIQQSAGDSALPETDVLLALFRYRFRYEDVADL